MSFESKAKVGYLALLLSLAVAMVMSIQRLAEVSNRHLAQLRAEETQITLVQRLRWKAELMVSEGRGYMLSADSDLLADLNEAKQDFEQSARALQTSALDAKGQALVREVEQAAAEFQRMQGELIALRQRSADTQLLRRRFESEPMLVHRALDLALNRLVEHKEQDLHVFYERAEHERAAFGVHLYGLLALITFTALILAWYLGSRLGAAYREERKALAAAQSAVAARDEMMGIVAHDLRNPLGLISLRAALIKNSKGIDPAEAQRHAEAIEQVATQMAQLISTMLDVTTIEAGKFAVAPAPIPAAELLGEVAALFEPLCAAKGICFERQAQPGQLTLFADRERLLQVLSNLIGNALKFTPAGGRISLAVEADGAAVRCTVSDTGPGVPAQNLPHLFERFWKDGASGQRGTGLGLFIAKGIVEAHGGRIWAENTSGGARFPFTLPAQPSGSSSTA